MEIRLARAAHPLPIQRIVGVPADDPYVPHCHLPVLGPTTVLLLRVAHELTGPVGSQPRALPYEQLSRQLGVGDTNKLAQTFDRARQFHVGRWDASGGRFEIFDPIGLVPLRWVKRLPELAKDWHMAHLHEVAQRLSDAGVKRPEELLANRDRGTVSSQQALVRLRAPALHTSPAVLGHEPREVSL